MGLFDGIVGSGLSAIGGLFGGLSQANASEALYNRRKEAYNEMLQRANQTQQAGEQSFYDNVNKQNPYLDIVSNDLKNQTNDVLNAGRNQLNASLSQQGVRGGQASTQLARGIGNMATTANRELNQMKYDDYAQRSNLKSAYDQAKALAGINANLQQFNG